jgi:hypothetical protein
MNTKHGNYYYLILDMGTFTQIKTFYTSKDVEDHMKELDGKDQFFQVAAVIRGHAKPFTFRRNLQIHTSYIPEPEEKERPTATPSTENELQYCGSSSASLSGGSNPNIQNIPREPSDVLETESPVRLSNDASSHKAEV